MNNPQRLPISIQPIISYPREAEVNKIYLMEIDIKQTDDFEKWLYEEEEYPIYCRVDTYSKRNTTPLFKIQPIGEPAVVLHRFGGTYGPAKFLLTAASKDIKGEIRVTLVNGWGVPLKMLRLRDVSITQEKTEVPIVSAKESGFVSKSSKLESFEFKAKVATIVFEEKENKLKTILLVEDGQKVIEDISEVLSSQSDIAVRGTDDVNEVIEQAQSGEIDLILINNQLPYSRYQDKKVNGIEIVRILRANPNISHYLPIVGFSMDYVEDEFLRDADGFYDKNKALNEGAEQDFLNYLRKIFNRVKVTEFIPYESAQDLDLVLDLMSKRHLKGLDTSQEEVANLSGKHKNDDGTYYLLENLSLLSVLSRKSSDNVEPGTVRYDLSNYYLNQHSPRPPLSPENEEYEIRRQQLHEGQRKLLKEIEKRNKDQQTTSQGNVAFLFNHPEGGNIATYRRLENLRLLGFLTITDIGTNQETIRYNLSPKYRQYLGLNTSNNSNSSNEINLQPFQFETPTVNRRGKTIKTITHTAQYFSEKLIVNKQLETNTTEELTLEMVAIPGGTFTMGSPENESEHDDELPQHDVTLSPFFMGKYPITQAQWKAIASRTDLKVNIDLNEDPSHFKDPYQAQDREIERWLRPVESVNWYEAVEFCQRLSKLTGRDYQLPSEAQWEYACRAVTESLDLEKADGTEPPSYGDSQAHQEGESYPPFYFGETITDQLANYRASETYADEPKGEGRSETTPVGQFPPNAFGLYDMHGNVWEWCADDWHDNYDDAPTDGSAWVDTSTSLNNESNEEENVNPENREYLDKNNRNSPYTVIRGGSWIDNPNYCRSALRDNDDPRAVRINNDGFRVVCLFGRTL